VFDDTMEHEAWNNSDQPRVILIFDVWNPRLSQTERDLVAAVMQAIDKFNGEAP
jgi:aspartate beta-hydroxylase